MCLDDESDSEPAVESETGRGYRAWMRPGGVRLPTVATFCSALVATSVYVAVQGVALGAEGASFLLQIIDRESIVGQDARSFALAVRQSPVLVGVWLGETDTHRLTLLLGAGQLVLPALIWVGVVSLARSDMVVFSAVVLAASISWATTAMFSVGELAFAIPVAMLLAVLLWLPARWRNWHALLAVGAAALLTRSHEATLLLACLYGPWASLRAVRAQTRVERAACVVTASLGVVAVVAALREIERRRGDPSAENLTDSVIRLLPLEIYTLLVLAACLVALLFVSNLAPALRLGLLAVAEICGIASAYGLFATDGDAYSGRGGALLVATVCVLLLLTLWLRKASPAPGSAASGAGWTGVWVVVVVACIPLVAAVLRAERWGDNLMRFREAVTRHHGLVPVEEVVPGDRIVIRNGTSPVLSLIVRRTPEDAILLDRPGIPLPFPPREARSQLDDRYTWGRR